ncbi:MAG: hypothetical protein SGI84_07055 [Gemmatimonadota bacterium]|nr:hypothetical protein [Gemmatimonadota bacterium]
MFCRTIALIPALLACPLLLSAQAVPPVVHQHVPGMVHTPEMDHEATTAMATEGGQSAFAAIAEIVKLLESDPTTDWAKVDMEALRQHLMDMDDVTLRAAVGQTPLAGGLTMEVTGQGRVAGAIQRMVTAHAPMLEDAGAWRATVTPIPGGVRLTVVVRDAGDAATATRIRGLGFIGLMTQGAHHTEHHLMIAKGAGEHAHAKP